MRETHGHRLIDEKVTSEVGAGPIPRDYDVEFELGQTPKSG